MPTHDIIDTQKKKALTAVKNLLNLVPAKGYRVRTSLTTQTKEKAILILVVERTPPPVQRRDINVWAAPVVMKPVREPELMSDEALAKKLIKPIKKRKNLLPKPPKER